MKVRIFIFLIPLFFLQACMVGPIYKKPLVKIPQHYTEQRKATTYQDLTDWWTVFNDTYLNTLIKKATDGNYDLKIACEQIVQARAVYGIATANLFPEVDMIGSINQSGVSKHVNAYSNLPSRTYSYGSVGFEALWELDFWGKLRRAKKSAYDLVEAQKEHMNDVYIILLSDVVKTYITIRTLQKKIDLLQQQIKIDTQLFTLLRDRFKSGIDGTIPSIDQLPVLDESKNQLLIAKTAFKQIVNSLALLLGENPEDFVFNTTPYGVPLSTKKVSVGLPSDLLRRRPDIREAECRLEAATEDVGSAIAARFPSFSLLASSILESNSISRLFSGTSLSWLIGPSMNWRMLTFGRIKFLIKEKDSLRRQALLAYCKSIVNAFTDVENTLIAYFNAHEKLELIARKFSAAIEKKELTASLVECGLASDLDLIETEKTSILRQIDKTEAEQVLSISVVSLYKALGGGW